MSSALVIVTIGRTTSGQVPQRMSAVRNLSSSWRNWRRGGQVGEDLAPDTGSGDWSDRLLALLYLVHDSIPPTWFSHPRSSLLYILLILSEHCLSVIMLLMS